MNNKEPNNREPNNREQNNKERTTNQSNKDIKFNPSKFNKSFEANEKLNNEINNNNINNNNIDTEYITVDNNYYPHKEPLDKIILNIRELFFIVLEMVIDKKNPIPFIMASETRKFSFALFLLIFGSLLLLLSTLMKSPY